MSAILDIQNQGSLTFVVRVESHPIRVLRRARRMTQAELAETVAVSRQTIIAVERGDYAPSVFLALRIARALETTVEQLFSIDDEHVPGGQK